MSYEPNPNHERGILCRQIKDDVINHLRSHRSDETGQELGIFWS